MTFRSLLLRARRIAAEMSGRDYEFTPAFVEDVRQPLTNIRAVSGTMVTRAQNATCGGERGPRSGADIDCGVWPVASRRSSVLHSMDESELNISPNLGGDRHAQFLPKTGEHLGLCRRLDGRGESAVAAARYIANELDSSRTIQ